VTEPFQLHDVHLVAEASHEMRAPLAVIRSYADLLVRRRSQISEPEIDEYLAVISRQTDRLVCIVDDLLAMSRLEHGSMPVDPEVLTVVPFLEDLVAGLGESGARIAVRLTTDVPVTIEADPVRLRQVLANLLQNALRYAPAMSSVTLSADADGPHAIAFEVIDEGPGVDPAELHHIFEPFYRGTAARDAEGAGLGLAISDRQVAAMGGRIEVTSERGCGARFRVTLPRSAAS
jgi:two-component system phosphate regulon sensor histidine kinase PhoR